MVRPFPPVTTQDSQCAVGTDLVILNANRLIIFARHEMSDWSVREFCVVPIHFRDHKFHLKNKSPAAAPYAMRYELAAWHSGLGTESTLAIHYDEDYVAERDRAARSDRRHFHLHAALFAVFPLLGFCWTGFKERVLAVIGFDPVEITEASVMVAFGFFMLEGVFVCYFQSGFLGVLFSRYWLVWLDYLLFIIVPLDCGMRFGSLISHDHVPPGFLEWLFRRSKPGNHAG